MKELFYPVIVSMVILNKTAKEISSSKTSAALAGEFMNNVLMMLGEIREVGPHLGVIISHKTLSIIKDSIKIGFELASIIENGSQPSEISLVSPPPELPSDLTWREFLDKIAAYLQYSVQSVGPDEFLKLFTDAAVGFGSKGWSVNQAGSVFVYCSLGLALSTAIVARSILPE